MNLVIDIGNTSCKVASYEALTLKSVQRFEDPSDLQAKTGSGYDTIVLASVRNEDRSLREHLRTRCRRFIDFNVDYVREQVAGGPAIYKYLDNMPDGMGADRMAAILQACILMPEEDILLFDFGTATTVEFIDKGHYVGGRHLPGAEYALPCPEPFHRQDTALRTSDNSCKGRYQYDIGGWIRP